VQQLGRMVPVPLYINRPLRRWPCVFGVNHEVTVPRSVKPNPLLPPRSGAANINISLGQMDKALKVRGDIAECGVFRVRPCLPWSYTLVNVEAQIK